MKKIVKLMLIIVALSSLFVGCGKKKDDGVDNSLKSIQDKGKLVLGLDDAFAPMGFRDENQEIVGFDIDVAKEVCKRMGVELELQPIAWSSKDQELKTKNIDCIWNGLSVDEDRKKKYELSTSYMKNTQVAVVPASSDASSLEDLAGKIVTIQNGSTAEGAVNANAEFKDSLKELVMVEDNIKALMDLEIGGSDAVVMDDIVARYYMAKDTTKYKILSSSLSEEEYAIGFRKGEVGLVEEVNKQLRAMKEDGTLAQISNTWFGEDLTIVE